MTLLQPLLRLLVLPKNLLKGEQGNEFWYCISRSLQYKETHMSQLL